MSNSSNRNRRERGSIAIETAVLAPIAILLLVFVAYAGMCGKAQVTIGAVASDASRAASIARSAPEAQAAGATAAAASFQQQGMECSQSSTSINVGGFATAPGTPATVSATISCRVTSSVLGVATFALGRTFTATAVSPLDSYRERS